MGMDTHDSTIIALVPDSPEELAGFGTEPPENLHVTVAYSKGLWKPDASGFAYQRQLTVIGVGTLGGEQAMVAFVQWPKMIGLSYQAERAMVAAGGAASEHDAFIGHLTLAYPATGGMADAFTRARKITGKRFSAHIEVWSGDHHWAA